MFPSVNPTQTAAWKKLQEHYDAESATTIKELFEADADRFKSFHLRLEDILFDFSKNNINANIISNFIVHSFKSSGILNMTTYNFENKISNIPNITEPTIPN